MYYVIILGTLIIEDVTSLRALQAERVECFLVCVGVTGEFVWPVYWLLHVPGDRDKDSIID